MVNADWTGTVGEPNEAEDSMLDLNPERAANSRLSCQMTVSDDLDGLIVDLPEFQF
jgi:2Fe-2S ferredoxin